MGLLDGVAWEGKVLKGGAWVDGGGGTYAVVEPATGDELGTMGQADADDVAEAGGLGGRGAEGVGGAAAHRAGRACCARPATSGPSTPTRSGTGTSARSARSRRWRTSPCTWRPRSATRPPSLPGQPIGQVLPSEQPRLSMARQVPAGVVAVISPFNVPIILGIRSVAPALALGNAVHPQAGPAHGGDRRHRDGADLRGGRAAARRAADAARRQGRRRGDGHRPARPGHLLHRLDRGRPVASASSPAATSSARTSSSAATPRCSILDDADVEKAVGLTGWASFLHQGQICMTTGRYFVADGIYDDFVDQLAAKAGHLPVGDPSTEQVALGPVIDERSARQDPRPGHRRASTRAPGWPRAASTTGSSTGRPCWPTYPLDLAGLHRGGLRPGRAGHPGLVGRGRGAAGGRGRLRALARHRHPRRDARPGARRADPDRHRAHQRPDRERRGERPVRRRRRVRASAGSAVRPPTSRRSPRPAGSRCAGSRPSYPF